MRDIERRLVQQVDELTEGQIERNAKIKELESQVEKLEMVLREIVRSSSDDRTRELAVVALSETTGYRKGE